MSAGVRARGAVGLALAVAASLLLLGWATDGFAVLTSDAARARAVREAPRLVPDVPVRDLAGNVHGVLADARPRAVIVDFIYTRCITLCSVLGGTYQRLQQAIVAQGLQDRVRLLTLSFDIAFDGPAQLAMHARIMRADPATWTLATPVHSADLDRLLDTFGVQVIADGTGGWLHNAALHVVSPDGRLVRIVDIDQPEAALAAAVAAYEEARR